MIGIIDYHAGNLFSVQKALEFLGLENRIVAAPVDLDGVRGLILPGVGHFAAAAAALRQNGLWPELQEWLHRGRPLLGICLGMQLLYGGSDEAPAESGLGFFPGRVTALQGPRRLHIGWNQVCFRDPWPGGAAPRWYYFVHGFAATADAGEAAGWSAFGAPFVAAAVSGAVWGVQFHPEKSGPQGLELLRLWRETCVDHA